MNSWKKNIWESVKKSEPTSEQLDDLHIYPTFQILFIDKAYDQKVFGRYNADMTYATHTEWLRGLNDKNPVVQYYH